MVIAIIFFLSLSIYALLSINLRVSRRILKYLSFTLFRKLLDIRIGESMHDIRGEGLLFNPTNQAGFGTTYLLFDRGMT